MTFIAINCRAVDGDCSTTHNNIIFPTITGNFAYGYIMINYLRPFSHAYLVSSLLCRMTDTFCEGYNLCNVNFSVEN